MFEDTWKSISPVYLEYLEKLRNELLKAGGCVEGFRIFRCDDCEAQFTVPLDCKSRLCNRCSKKLHKVRVRKCLNKIGHHKRFTHLVLTLPQECWSRVDSWAEILKLRQQAARVFRDLVGVGGVVVVHTFSTDNQHRWAPHVHIIGYGRRPTDWDAIRRRWGVFLRRRYGYRGECNIYEKPFHRQRLAHRLRYVLRMPEIRFDTLRHFAFAKSKAIYSFFGRGVHECKTDGQKFEETVTCPECKSRNVQLIGKFEDGCFEMVYGWHEGLLSENIHRKARSHLKKVLDA